MAMCLLKSTFSSNLAVISLIHFFFSFLCFLIERYWLTLLWYKCCFFFFCCNVTMNAIQKYSIQRMLLTPVVSVFFSFFFFRSILLFDDVSLSVKAGKNLQDYHDLHLLMVISVLALLQPQEQTTHIVFPYLESLSRMVCMTLCKILTSELDDHASYNIVHQFSLISSDNSQ